MDKQEFFDKITKVREMVDALGGEITHDEVMEAVRVIDELKEDAEQLLQDEYDLGLNRGWNHIDEEEQF